MSAEPRLRVLPREHHGRLRAWPRSNAAREDSRPSGTDTVGTLSKQGMAGCRGVREDPELRGIPRDTSRGTPRSWTDLGGARLVVAAPEVVERPLEEESVHASDLEPCIGRTISLRTEPAYDREHFDCVLL